MNASQITPMATINPVPRIKLPAYRGFLLKLYGPVTVRIWFLWMCPEDQMRMDWPTTMRKTPVYRLADVGFARNRNRTPRSPESFVRCCFTQWCNFDKSILQSKVYTPRRAAFGKDLYYQNLRRTNYLSLPLDATRVQRQMIPPHKVQKKLSDPHDTGLFKQFFTISQQ